jgi:transposase
MIASEKNRLYKLFIDAGVRLDVMVPDWHGQSARATVKALIAGISLPEVLSLASNRLRICRKHWAAAGSVDTGLTFLSFLEL